MPLSWNEIKDRALRFSREWAFEASEDAEAKSFWDGFFEVFGVSRRRVASFERKVKKLDGKDGYIDLLWKGVLLVEHKSRGKDLDRAHAQARDYFAGLGDAELPRYLLVSDFARFRLYDLDEDAEPVEFALADLHKQVRRFGFLAGYQARAFKDEDPVNVEAAERMGRLHDALKAAGYDGHALEVLLVRLLFCLFADDTGIFPRLAFHELVAQRTSPDGADLGLWLAQLFQTLNTAPDRRQNTLDAQLAEFPYVNGKLFAEALPLAAFNSKMRILLLDASALDWSRISPAIFGSMFQSVMDAKARRNLGAHYTSEKNILKLIGPLFLDDLVAELARIGNHEGKLKSFHVKLANLRFLDPACGCGNFLVIAYRELRLLELEVLRRQFEKQASVLTRVSEHVAVDVDQFFGIEIEEFPAQIAQVALWLMDHQMNLRVAEQFGEYFARLPLVKSPTIVHGNALRIDWNDVVPAEKLNYILGNPPFVGKKEQNAAQKADMALVWKGVKGAGVLDFVSAWYLKAAEYLRPSPAVTGAGGAGAPDRAGGKSPSSGAARHLLPEGEGKDIRCAFVSTNSITQGEQVGVLWAELYRHGMHIQFAHRTFKWSNEARGKAAVHCVIIGFACVRSDSPRLFDYERADGEAHVLEARGINAYLLDAPEVLLESRSSSISAAPSMGYGSFALDDGNYTLGSEDYDQLVFECPEAQRFLRRFVGGQELLHSENRWCLWLKNADPAEVRRMPQVLARVERVKSWRLSSNRETTRNLAQTPTLFAEIRQPDSSYIAAPTVSSERRSYIPMAFLSPEVIASNQIYIMPNASLFHFGVLMSMMHMAWVRSVCGRLESRYRYSAGIVYNNFPWPELAVPSPSGRRWPEGPDEGAVTSPKPPIPANTLAFARQLRQDATDAETYLWQLLRDRRMGGFKFRRQHPSPPYVLDFYCDSEKLAIELDGGQHVDRETADQVRSDVLSERGIRVLRFWNDAMFKQTEDVLGAIWAALHKMPSSDPSGYLLPEGEGSKAAIGAALHKMPSSDPSGHLLPEGEGNRVAIERAAQGVLDARALFPQATLADLYDPLTMPPALVKAHQRLDKAVDAAYVSAEKAAGRKAPKLGSDTERVAFLFERYQALTSLLPVAKAKSRRKSRTN